MKKTNTFFAIRQVWTAFLVAAGMLLFCAEANLMAQCPDSGIVRDSLSFETTGGGTEVTTNAGGNFGGTGGGDTYNTGISVGGRFPYSGNVGNFFGYDDLDGAGGTSADIKSFNSAELSLAGYSGTKIKVSGLFGAMDQTSEYDGNDHIIVRYRLKTAGVWSGYTDILSFLDESDPTFGESLFFNGAASASNRLTRTLQCFTSNFVDITDATDIQLQFEINANSSTLDGVIDEVKIFELCSITPLSPIVECTADGFYQVTVPYIGSDATGISVTNSSGSGSVTFDPTIVDGSIVVSGISDANDWNFELVAGSCSETFSGTAPNCVRPTCPAIVPPTGTGITVSTCFTGGNTSQAGQDAAADADPTLNTPYGTWAGAVNRAEIDGITTITFETGHYISDNTVSFAFGADNAILAAIENLKVYGNGSVIEQAVGGTQVSFIIIDGVNNIEINDFNFINFDKTFGSIAYIEDATGIVFNNITVDGSDRGGDAFHITASAEDTEVTFYCSQFYNHFSHNPPNSVMTIVGDGSTNEGSHTVTANFVDTEWRCNDRNGFGGALTITGGDNATPGPNVNFWGGVFSDNVANATDAGAIYASGDTNLFIDGTEFICNSNTSNDGSGGGALFVGDDSNLTIYNANFSNNVSRLDGGAITFNGSGQLTIQSTEFHNNIATGGAGGGIFYRGKNANATPAANITNCYFNGNTDGIYFEGVGNLSPMTLNISNTTITGSLGRGLAIESSDSDEDFVNVIGSVLCGNTGFDLDQNFEPATLTVDGFSVIGTGDSPAPQGDCSSYAASLGYQGGTPQALACGSCLIGSATATASCEETSCDDCFTDTCNSSQQTDANWATILPAAGIGSLGAGDCNEVTTSTTQVDLSTPAFAPSDPTVTLGDQVDFNWLSGTHNVNFTDNGNSAATTDAWDSGATTGTTGINHSIIADVAGTYAFQCDPHAGGGMTGTLTVAPMIFCSEFVLAAADVPMYFTADAKFDFTGTCDPTATHSIQQENGVTCDVVAPLYDNANNTGNNTTNPVYYIETAGTYTHCITITALGDASCVISNVCPARVTSCGSCDLATCDNAYQVGYDEFNPTTPSATTLQADNACNTITPMLTTAGDQTTICTTYSPAIGDGGYTGIGTSFSTVCGSNVTLNTVVSNNTDNANCNDITTTIPNDNGFPVYDLAEGSTYEICVTATLTANCDLSELCIAPYGFASISGTAFYDDEATGDIQGDGTIDGVIVTLFDSNNNQIDQLTTDINGDYEFENVPNGDYYVTFTTPSGYGITTVNPNPFSTTDANNSDIDATGTTPTFTVTDIDITDIDAGYINGSLAGTVFTDTDGNGLDNDGADVSGVEVQLFNAGGQVLTDADGVAFGTVTTDASGDYIFNNLPLGDYYVVFPTLPTNNVFTTQDVDANVTDTDDSDPNTTTGQTGSYTLDATTPNVTDVDAGLFVPASISGTAYSDLVTVDDLSTGEATLPNVPVALYTSAGVQVTTDINGAALPTMTDASGNYMFDNLPLGDYYVQFTTPASSTIATQDVGGDDTIDSDINSSGQTATITLTSGLDVTDVDAIYPAATGATVSGTVFHDDELTPDGLITGDNGIQGVTVSLFDAGGTQVGSSVMTDASGNYSFTDVPDGTGYYVTFTTPSGYAITQQLDTDPTDDDDSDIDATDVAATTSNTNPFNVSGADVTDIDAGYINGTLAGTAFTDTNGNGLDDDTADVMGVTVTLYSVATGMQATHPDGSNVAPIVTPANGDYQFTNLPLGDYYVIFTTLPTDNILTAQDANSNGNDTTDSDANTTTGQTGNYSLTALAPDVTDVDAGMFNPINISGTVFIDTDMNGTDDDAASPSTPVTVTLIDASTGLPATGFAPITTTSTYTFSDVPPGSYYVTFSTPSGTTITTSGTNSSTITDLTDIDDSDIDNTGQTPTFVVASGDADIDNLDAGFQPQAATIGDFAFIDLDNDGIFNNDDAPLVGVTATLYDANTDAATSFTATTDATGAYSFTNVPASTGDGYYVVFTAPAGYVVATAGSGDNQNNITDATGAGSTNDFTFDGTTNNLNLDAGFVGTGQIGDFVWEDTNGNGLQDEVGTGIDGVTITLTWFGPDGVSGTPDDVTYPTQDTAGGGAYNFTNLPMGVFSVAVTANTPSGSLTASPPATITLTDAAPTVDTADFGYQPACNANTGTFPNN